MFAILAELHAALGDDVWTGYGVNTGVISYAQGDEPNSFKATFMGGTYEIEIPFGDFTSATKTDNGDGTFTYDLVVNLPAQTGMSQETLHVTTNANGEIIEMESENAGIELQKETDGTIATWEDLQNAMNAGGVIKLGENVIAENTDAALEVPAGKTVVLELNGFNINRNLNAAVANGSVIINNGTLAIMGEGQITGGKTTGNGGGVLNNGILTLYGGEITGNAAAIGGGVYNNGGAQGFWMTGGLIDGNSASSYPAIGGEVIFNENAAVQIDAQGTQVTIAQALAGLATYSYIKPVMPNYDELETDYTLLLELYNALGDDVWTGYGVNTGVISYSQGTEPNSFNASFMGGTYSFDLPFEAFTEVSKADNGDGTYTYTLVVNLPAQTGMGTETLHVTMNANGEITEMESENAGIEMQKEEGPVTGWAALQNAMNAGGVIKLGENVIAENTDAALEVPAGKTVVLELNGFNINRNLNAAVANGSVIINNGTLAIMGEGQITGGKTTGNGGGVLNNGILTLYGGEITGNAAAIGGGVYNNGGAQGFWMTGGLIDGNSASSYPAIGGEVIFNENAAVQIDAQGTQVTIAQALAGLATYSYIKPVMPNYDELETDYTLLLELYNALGDDVWTGYGVNTGVISYSQGTEPNSFNASFMGGTYSFDLPFEAFTEVSKADNGDGTYTYTLVVNLPAQTGMGTETLHVTMNANGEITEMESENAGIEMQKEEGPVTGWAALQNAMNAGGVIKLGENVIAENTDAALEVPAGKTVVLELNGFNINRNLNAAVANGSVIINNGTLAIMGEGQITGGKTTGNGGGVLNNGILTLYGGEITGNAAAIGGGVYNNGGAQGFWMTGGLIDGNSASSYPAIGGEVIFNENAAVQIDAQGTQVTIAQALAGLATYSYIKPVMPNYDELETDYTLLLELYNALGDDVWTGYGVNTGVISYSQGTEPNSFNASFMGGTYSFDLPFEAFTEVSKADNGDGTYTYTLVVNLPAQTGMGTETLHVTMNANGEITEMESENAGIEMQKEEGPVTGWAALQNAMNAGGVIKLGENVIAENTDAALEVPAGKTVVLELNGFNINRNLNAAVANGSVIINNGTLAIMGEGQITGGKTTGNGGGVLNNGILTLYGGEITGNAAAIGGGVYNNGGAQGFWMTGGLIDGNSASSYPAIGGEVIFNNMAVVQINADGDKVSIEQAIAGMATYDYIKPVMPDYDDYTTEVAITANVDPENPAVYYSTFFDSANKYMLPAGVEAYVADLSGSDLVLTRIAVAGQVIPANEAVIFKASAANFNLTPSFEVPVSVSAHNSLEGVDVATPLDDLGIDPLKCYVLSGTAQYGVGFYRINANTLKAHKAYVIYNGNQNSAPKRMRFIFNNEQTTTGVDNTNVTIESQKVLENGVLYIIKNGVRYNVQGQIVK